MLLMLSKKMENNTLATQVLFDNNVQKCTLLLMLLFFPYPLNILINEKKKGINKGYKNIEK